jgi:Family of unknown function (DUF5329)
VLHRYRVVPGVVLLAVLAVATPVVLAATTPTSQAEIEYLLGHLGESGCEFFRNGKWFPAANARDHLRKKFDYLVKKDLVDTAEHFIERAATESSRSGEPYRVRCPGAAETPSARWLADELARYRSRQAR